MAKKKVAPKGRTTTTGTATTKKKKRAPAPEPEARTTKKVAKKSPPAEKTRAPKRPKAAGRSATRTRPSARKQAEQRSNGDSWTMSVPEGVKLFKLKDDKPKRVDILPYIVGKGHEYADEGQEFYERTYFTHANIGAEKRAYICPLKTAKKPCPVCEFRSAQVKKADHDEDLIKSLAPKERQLFNVIDRDDKEAGIQIWDISYHLFGKALLNEVKSADDDEDMEEAEKFWYPDEGKMIRLGIEEKQFAGNKFFEVTSIRFKDRPSQYDASIAEEAHCLDDLLKVPTYDDLKKAFMESGDESSDDDGDDDSEIEVGSIVACKEFGEGEVTKLSRDKKSCSIELADGGIVKHKVPVKSLTVLDDYSDDEESDDEEVEDDEEYDDSEGSELYDEEEEESDEESEEEDEEFDDDEEEVDDDEEYEEEEESDEEEEEDEDWDDDDE